MLFTRRPMFLFSPEADKGGDGNPGDKTTPTGGEAADPVVSMPQKQMNALMSERGEQGRRALLKELGFENPDEIKSLLAKAREQEDAQKTESQKLTEQVQKAQELARKAEAEKTEALSKAQEKLTRSMVLVEAGALKFADPQDAWQFIDKSKLKINEETGEVEGVKAALEALVKSKPYLVKSASGKSPDIDATTNSGGASGELTEERKKELEQRFRLRRK